MLIKLKNIRHCLIVVFTLLCFFAKAETADNERPKVGLVLSGGGAKGFAHVGVLKELEKYNIPIDYIGGTSIGAIIGGLYAVGYSAEQIEQMILSQDWEGLFADEPKRTYMPFYEKNEQGRYLVSMHFEDYKLKIPNYALTNNGIIRLFTDLTQGYHDVYDFDSLPTPFLCITVDLVTGEEVVLDKGYLPMAMAASMAIPGIFPSINDGEKLYIDGGARNNFPVDHLRDRGADIVIGVDVGAGMQGKDQLNKITSVVDQLTTMIGSEKFELNHNNCDVYIKPDIAEFTVSDFTTDAARKMLARGEEAGEYMNKKLLALQDTFKQYSFPQRAGYESIALAREKMVTHFVIKGSRLADEDVLGIMGVDEETDYQCTVGEVGTAIDRLHASMKFYKINYQLVKHKHNEDYTLILDLIEDSSNGVNFGAHYNTQDDVALLFNGTFNALILRNSRLSLDLKLSENTAFDLHYNINRGNLPGLGVNYGFRSRKINHIQGNTLVGYADVKKNYFEVNSNSIINDYFTVGLGARYEGFNVSNSLGSYTSNGLYEYFLYRFFFEVDTKDRQHYPTKGVKYFSHTDLITNNGYDLYGEVPAVVTYLSMEQTIKLDELWTITPQLYVRLQFNDSPELPVFYNAYVGGVYQPQDITTQIPFWGMRWGELLTRNALSLGAENRFQIGEKHYLYGNLNVLASSEVFREFTPDHLNIRVGGAIGYSFESLVGPLEIYLSLANQGNIRTFLNIGYYF